MNFLFIYIISAEVELLTVTAKFIGVLPVAPFRLFIHLQWPEGLIHPERFASSTDHMQAS